MNERRFTPTTVDQQQGKIRGTASVTYDGTPGSEYQLWEGVFERIAPGAFDDALASNPDVICCFNHDPNFVLGRTPNTLALRADNKGLHYECDPPDTQQARDLLVSIGRGDIRGSSFAFHADKVEWQQEKGKEIRMIQKATLYDVSCVTSPAYGNSTTYVRAEVRSALEEERKDYYDILETEKRLKKLDHINASKDRK